jgi:DNA-binding MarR family transcriptional regulator
MVKLLQLFFPGAGSMRRRFDSAEQEAYLVLWRTYDRLRALEEKCFAAWELTAQQYNLLRLLRSTAPQAMLSTQAADRLISRAPDVTRMLDRLEARHLLTRTRSETDRRAVLIAITAAGLALLDEIDAPLAACHRAQLGHLSPAELAQLTHLLKRTAAPHEPPESPWRA